MKITGWLLAWGALFPIRATAQSAASPHLHLPGTDIPGCATQAACDERCAHGDAATCRALADAFSFQRQGDIAHGYYTRGCVAGAPADCRVIGARYESGTGVLPDRERAKEFYEIACRRGDHDGCAGADRMRAPPPEPPRPPAPEPLPPWPLPIPDFGPGSAAVNCQPEDRVIPAPLPLRPGIIAYNADEVDQPAKLISESQKTPCYPELARQQGLDGKVVIELLVDDTGVVVDARVIHSDHPAFNAVSLTVARQRRYLPAQMKGQPVAVYHTVTMGFSLH